MTPVLLCAQCQKSSLPEAASATLNAPAKAIFAKEPCWLAVAPRMTS